MLEKITKKIANTKIVVSYPIWILRNIVMVFAAILCIYLGVSIRPISLTNLLQIGGGGFVLYVLFRGY